MSGGYSGRFSPMVREAVNAAARARQGRCYCADLKGGAICGFCEARIEMAQDCDADREAWL